MPSIYSIRISWFFPVSLTLAFSWPKLTTTPLYKGIFQNYSTCNILQPVPLKIIQKIKFVSFFVIVSPLSTIFLVISVEYCTRPLFLVYAMYIHKHICMCRLFRTLNNNMDYKTLILLSIPTWTNILFNLIWENKVTYKLEIPENYRIKGIISTESEFMRNKHDLKNLKVMIPQTSQTYILTKNFPIKKKKTFSVNTYSKTNLVMYTLVGRRFLALYFMKTSVV